MGMFDESDIQITKPVKQAESKHIQDDLFEVNSRPPSDKKVLNIGELFEIEEAKGATTKQEPLEDLFDIEHAPISPLPQSTADDIHSCDIFEPSIYTPDSSKYRAEYIKNIAEKIGNIEVDYSEADNVATPENPLSIETEVIEEEAARRVIFKFRNLKGNPGEGETDTSEIKKDINDLMSVVFPLKATYSNTNAGTYEIGTKINPYVTLNVTKQNADVIDKVIFTKPIRAEYTKNGWIHETIDNVSLSFNTKVTDKDENIYVGNLNWKLANYRYYGILDSIPVDYESVIPTLSKELSDSPFIEQDVPNDKYFLFAVVGKMNLIASPIPFGGIVTNCIVGNCVLPRINKTGNDVYTYILVPASKSDWRVKINQ